MLKEILIFMTLFILLSLSMHYNEWIEYPVEHFINLPDSGAYGFGFMHPLIFTLIVYVILYIIRATIKIIVKLSR